MEQEQGHVNTSCGATATAFAQGVAASAHHTSYETLMREAAVARRGPLIVAVHSAFGQALTLDTAAHALVWREAERLLDVAAALGRSVADLTPTTERSVRRVVARTLRTEWDRGQRALDRALSSHPAYAHNGDSVDAVLDGLSEYKGVLVSAAMGVAWSEYCASVACACGVAFAVERPSLAVRLLRESEVRP